MKKMRIFWLFMLVILLGFSSIISGVFLQGKSIVSGAIITVDDEGDGDYTSIKEAVNHSNPGDIIEVYSGTYYERCINITTDGITLKGVSHELGNGNDTGKPFINGGGRFVVISVIAHNVTLTGFHMENEGEYATVVVEIDCGGYGCVLMDNDLSHSVMACVQCTANYCRIVNNTISHSSIRQGILLYEPGTHNTVSGNFISDCEYGIYVWTPGTNNEIEGNRISRCRSYGICIFGSDDNTVYCNTFEENHLDLFLSSSVGNKIEKNNFINNTQSADFILGLELPLRSKWVQNYWGEPRLLPYPIIGQFLFFPWVNFDWHPAQKPYDIS